MIYILMGLSAAGKDTLRDCMVKDFGLESIVAMTTRPKRACETEGLEYNFLSDSEFDKVLDNNGFIETRTFNALYEGKPVVWRYGTPKIRINPTKDYVTIKDYDGMLELRKHYGERNVCPVWVECNDEERMFRAMSRDTFHQDEWERREQRDKSSFPVDWREKISHKTVYTDGTMSAIDNARYLLA